MSACEGNDLAVVDGRAKDIPVAGLCDFASLLSSGADLDSAPPTGKRQAVEAWRSISLVLAVIL